MESISRLLVAFLLNAAWQVTAVFLLALLLARLLRAAPARYLHGFWVLTLAVCVLLPIWSARSLRQNADGPVVVAVPALPVLPVPAVVPAIPGEFRGAQAQASAPVTPRPSVWSRLRQAIQQPIPCPPALARALTLAYGLFLIYALARFGHAWRRKTRILGDASALPVSPELERIASDTKRGFGLDDVRILWSPDAPSPLTAGVWRPVIVLPECLLREQPEQMLTAVLAHEMAHIRRRDFFFNLLFELLLLPFAFHPAALAVRSRIARTREQACDEVVAGRAVEAPAYARALLDLARLFSPARTPRYSVGACDTDVLEERIMRIMKLRDLTGSRRTRFLLVCACLAVLALGAVAAALPVQLERGATQTGAGLRVVKGTITMAFPAAAVVSDATPSGLTPLEKQLDPLEIASTADSPGSAQQAAPVGNQLEARNEVAMGVQAYKAEQYDQAIAHFKRATELDPSSLNARLYLATTYSSQFVPGVDTAENVRRADAAMAEYRKVLEIAPDDANALNALAYLTFQLKQFADARRWYQKLIDVQPQNAAAYYSLGVIDWTESYLPRMKFKAEHGIRPDAPLEPASLREEVCSKSRPLIDDGMRVLNKAIELRPDYEDAMIYLNLMYREQADCEATPDARRQDEQQADQLMRKVMEMRKKRAEEGRQNTPTAAPPPPPPANREEQIKAIEARLRSLKEAEAASPLDPVHPERAQRQSQIRALEDMLERLRKQPPPPPVGSSAPDFTLPDSDGSPVALANYRGKWVLIQFMLITCPHCQEVDKVLKRLHQEYPGQLQPLDIAMPGHRLGALDDYKKELGLTYPVTLADQKVAPAYFGGPVNQVPAFVLISPSGEIVEQRYALREADRDFYTNTPKNLEAMIRRAILPK